MEMVVVVALAAALALPFVLAWNYRHATKRLVLADQAWGSLEQHAHALLNDRHLNPRVGDFVERVLLEVGNGALTRSFLLFVVFRPKPKDGTPSDLVLAFRSMEPGQEKQLSHFMVDAIFYDSLRTTVSGAILRRAVLYWLEATARDETAPVSRPQIKPITFAANRAFRAA